MRVLSLLSIALLATGLVFAADDPGSGPASGAESGAEVVNKFMAATAEQETAMRGVSMQVDISAEVPKLQKQGKLHALRNISKLGKITYNALGFIGDKAVKNEVIARFLNADTESQTGQDISISPKNYKFKFKGLQQYEGQDAYLFQLSPRKKRVGLFKGDLWIDPQTYMPIRESGRFVKSPSIFLKKIEFVRTYQLKDGLALPQCLESRLQTRIFGPVNLTISYTNFSRETGSDLAASAVSSVQ